MQYFLAYLGTGKVKYELLELSLFEEKSKVDDFDSTVRKENLLEYEASISTSPKGRWWSKRRPTRSDCSTISGSAG